MGDDFLPKALRRQVAAPLGDLPAAGKTVEYPKRSRFADAVSAVFFQDEKFGNVVRVGQRIVLAAGSDQDKARQPAVCPDKERKAPRFLPVGIQLGVAEISVFRKIFL